MGFQGEVELARSLVEDETLERLDRRANEIRARGILDVCTWMMVNMMAKELEGNDVAGYVVMHLMKMMMHVEIMGVFRRAIVGGGGEEGRGEGKVAGGCREGNAVVIEQSFGNNEDFDIQVLFEGVGVSV
jgi:hypothetical protein